MGCASGLRLVSIMLSPHLPHALCWSQVYWASGGTSQQYGADQGLKAGRKSGMSSQASYRLFGERVRRLGRGEWSAHATRD